MLFSSGLSVILNLPKKAKEKEEFMKKTVEGKGLVGGCSEVGLVSAVYTPLTLPISLSLPLPLPIPILVSLPTNISLEDTQTQGLGLAQGYSACEADLDQGKKSEGF